MTVSHTSSIWKYTLMGFLFYRKETHTAQFVNFESFTKWNHKIAWIRSLVNRAKRLCTQNKLADEIKNIKRFASYNGFPRWIVNKIVNQSVEPPTPPLQEEEQDMESVHLYMFLPFFGKEAEAIVQRTKKRIFKLLRKDKKIVFRIQFQTTKLSFFSSNKDKTPLLSDSNVIYQFSCPACCSSYIGKTESTLFNRTREHAWTDQKSAINKHFNTCPAWKHITGLFEIETEEEINKREFQINAVRQNTKILKRSDNWLKLAFQESLAIKEQKPALNHGIKSCKELALF